MKRLGREAGLPNPVGLLLLAISVFLFVLHQSSTYNALYEGPHTPIEGYREGPGVWLIHSYTYHVLTPK